MAPHLHGIILIAVVEDRMVRIRRFIDRKSGWRKGFHSVTSAGHSCATLYVIGGAREAREWERSSVQVDEVCRFDHCRIATEPGRMPCSAMGEAAVADRTTQLPIPEWMDGPRLRRGHGHDASSPAR